MGRNGTLFGTFILLCQQPPREEGGERGERVLSLRPRARPPIGLRHPSRLVNILAFLSGPLPLKLRGLESLGNCFWTRAMLMLVAKTRDVDASLWGTPEWPCFDAGGDKRPEWGWPDGWGC